MVKVALISVALAAAGVFGGAATSTSCEIIILSQLRKVETHDVTCDEQLNCSPHGEQSAAAPDSSGWSASVSSGRAHADQVSSALTSLMQYAHGRCSSSGGFDIFWPPTQTFGVAQSTFSMRFSVRSRCIAELRGNISVDVRDGAGAADFQLIDGSTGIYSIRVDSCSDCSTIATIDRHFDFKPDFVYELVVGVSSRGDASTSFDLYLDVSTPVTALVWGDVKQLYR